MFDFKTITAYRGREIESFFWEATCQLETAGKEFPRLGGDFKASQWLPVGNWEEKTPACKGPARECIMEVGHHLFRANKSWKDKVTSEIKDNMPLLWVHKMFTSDLDKLSNETLFPFLPISMGLETNYSNLVSILHHNCHWPLPKWQHPCLHTTSKWPEMAFPSSVGKHGRT